MKRITITTLLLVIGVVLSSTPAKAPPVVISLTCTAIGIAPLFAGDSYAGANMYGRYVVSTTVQVELSMANYLSVYTGQGAGEGSRYYDRYVNLPGGVSSLSGPVVIANHPGPVLIASAYVDGYLDWGYTCEDDYSISLD